MSVGIARNNCRENVDTVRYASFARIRPAARNTSSASGRRPISRASTASNTWGAPSRALSPTDGVAVAADLRVDRFAEAEALVAEFVDVFGLESVGRRVDVADGLEEAEGEESVNGGKHRDASSAPCGRMEVGVPS